MNDDSHSLSRRTPRPCRCSHRYAGDRRKARCNGGESLNTLYQRDGRGREALSE
ncbi:hypothetical protein [Paenibacillus humicola]|uniref:hypothetical protein n=1 Tax=Paenibacillus humicola TaxID=3110540 RepID=UPI00237BE7B1|nr:hypothetical protein [Paenibacillus humicola]